MKTGFTEHRAGASWPRVAAASCVFGVLLLAWGSPRSAFAAPSRSVLEKRYRAKLAEPWVAKGGWIMSYEQAKERARKTGRLIFAYFSRSYFH